MLFSFFLFFFLLCSFHSFLQSSSRFCIKILLSFFLSVLPFFLSLSISAFLSLSISGHLSILIHLSISDFIFSFFPYFRHSLFIYLFLLYSLCIYFCLMYYSVSFFSLLNITFIVLLPIFRFSLLSRTLFSRTLSWLHVVELIRVTQSTAILSLWNHCLLNIALLLIVSQGHPITVKIKENSLFTPVIIFVSLFKQPNYAAFLCALSLDYGSDHGSPQGPNLFSSKQRLALYSPSLHPVLLLYRPINFNRLFSGCSYLPFCNMASSVF